MQFRQCQGACREGTLLHSPCLLSLPPVYNPNHLLSLPASRALNPLPSTPCLHPSHHLLLTFPRFIAPHCTLLPPSPLSLPHPSLDSLPLSSHLQTVQRMLWREPEPFCSDPQRYGNPAQCLQAAGPRKFVVDPRRVVVAQTNRCCAVWVDKVLPGESWRF